MQSHSNLQLHRGMHLTQSGTVLYTLQVTPRLPLGPAVKNTPAKAGDAGLIPGLGRSPGGEDSNPL